MAARRSLLNGVKNVLAERSFSDRQIDLIIPKLNDNYFREPKALAQIIDTWNVIMNPSNQMLDEATEQLKCEHVPQVAKAPIGSNFGQLNKDVDMTTILADVEPSLLLFDPDKLVARHKKVTGMNLAKNMGEQWTMLYYAPRGFYLQNWTDLVKKIYYIEHNLLDFLYDRKEQKEMKVHPLIKSASIVEYDFDHIRARYLFALRSGYKSLSHMYQVQMAMNIPILNDLVATDDEAFLEKFAPFCSPEEYIAFSNLINKNDIDTDDAEVFEQLAELDGLNA